MKHLFLILGITMLSAIAYAAPESKVYVGTITDSMCIRDHSAMGVTPADKCVLDCVRHSKDVKLVLVVDGKTAYTLSDQETPLKFASQKVKIKGVLYAKTNVLKVESIEAVRQ